MCSFQMWALTDTSSLCKWLLESSVGRESSKCNTSLENEWIVRIVLSLAKLSTHTVFFVQYSPTTTEIISARHALRCLAETFWLWVTYMRFLLSVLIFLGHPHRVRYNLTHCGLMLWNQCRRASETQCYVFADLTSIRRYSRCLHTVL